MKNYIVYSLLFVIAFCSCVSNDYSPEYQKELIYDGYGIRIDTVGIKTYVVTPIKDSVDKKQLYDETTKWYDLNGFHSMTRSVSYLPGGERMTTEKITRDKHSLAIARDVIIGSATTEPVVTLNRLKTRKDGKEEWLIRHYLDPQKYIEDASTILYTEDKRIFKKEENDILQIRRVDMFDDKGRMTEQYTVSSDEKAPFVRTYYNLNTNNVDSIVSTLYENNDNTRSVIWRESEQYRYDINADGSPQRKYTYRNDSLIYITEYQYGYRQ